VLSQIFDFIYENELDERSIKFFNESILPGFVKQSLPTREKQELIVSMIFKKVFGESFTSI